jgi:hypothetical protein
VKALPSTSQPSYQPRGRSRRGRFGRTAALLVLVAAIGLSLVAAEQAGATSGWPLKDRNDSGFVTKNDDYLHNFTGWSTCRNPNGGDCTVIGLQACILANASQLWNTSNPQQQWNVPGCVAISTPWIATKPSTTAGWAIYCGGPTPYQYADFPIGGIQWWAERDGGRDGQSWIGNFYSSGLDNASKVDKTAHNWSLVSTHYWGFYAACSSTNPNGATFGQGGNYCCAQGFLYPVFGLQFGAGAGAGSAGTPGRPRAVMARGPARRTTRYSRYYHETTHEVDVTPNGRRTYRRTCPRGYRAVFRRATLGYYTTRRVGRRYSKRVRIRERRIGARTLAVTVRTGRIKRREVRLQTHIGCVRRGHRPPSAVRPD